MAPLHVVLFFILGCGLGVVVHELGHWLCGVLVGIPIRLVRIGSGPDLAVFRVGETIVELRAILLSGLVSPYPVLEWKASAELLFVLGGVVANVALFAIVLALPRTPATPDWAIDAVWGIAWAQIGMVLSNLTPRTLHHGLQSDGALILALVSKGRPPSGTRRTACGTARGSRPMRGRGKTSGGSRKRPRGSSTISVATAPRPLQRTIGSTPARRCCGTWGAAACGARRR